MRDGNMQARPNAEPPFRRLGGVTLGCRPRPRSGSCPQGQQQRTSWHRSEGVSDTGPAPGWPSFISVDTLITCPSSTSYVELHLHGGANFPARLRPNEVGPLAALAPGHDNYPALRNSLTRTQPQAGPSFFSVVPPAAWGHREPPLRCVEALKEG